MTELIKLMTIHGRELGIDLWFMAQSCFDIDRYSLDNSSTIISFSVGHNSAPIIQKAMNMTEKELLLLQQTPKGIGAVLKRESSPFPVLVKFPNYSLSPVTTEMRDILMEPRLREMREKYLTVIKDELTTPSEESNTMSDLDPDKIHILKDIANSPYETLKERSDKLKYNISTLFRHLKALKEKNYIQEIVINPGKGIGGIKIYKTEKKAIDLVGKQNLVGRGSMVHGFWMHTIKKYYES